MGVLLLSAILDFFFEDMGSEAARQTRFRWMFMEPLASMVAVSPRRATTLPRIRTVWFVKFSRYWALIRGVASDAMLGGGGVGGDRMLAGSWARGLFPRRIWRKTRDHVILDKLTRPRFSVLPSSSNEDNLALQISIWRVDPWRPLISC